MNILIALILGLVQGLTEFLPVSSSGHLLLIKYFFQISEMGDFSFEIFVHLGTLCAVVIFFQHDIIGLLKSLFYFRQPEGLQQRKTCLWLFLATLVTGCFGFIGKEYVIKITHPMFIACMIGITGLILYISDKIKNFHLPANEIGIKKAIIIGLGQALAITPGISRSGTTIFCGLLVGLDRKAAATFTFLLAIPVILGANITQITVLSNLEINQLFNYIVGFFAAFLSGYLVIAWLMKLIIKAQLIYFAYYCWGVSLLSLFLIWRNFT